MWKLLKITRQRADHGPAARVGNAALKSFDRSAVKRAYGLGEHKPGVGGIDGQVAAAVDSVGFNLTGRDSEPELSSVLVSFEIDGPYAALSRRKIGWSESLVEAAGKKRGHGEALPASPWPFNRWNEGTFRSTLPIHGVISIDLSASNTGVELVEA